jgi:DNA-binding NarL/FixJ family response regulator
MKPLRILVADDHDIVRRGLRPLLESEDGWEVCGEAADGEQAVEMSGRMKPDVVVLDITMPLLDGVEATRQIRRQHPETEVLAFTGTESESLVHRLFAAGARACVLKTEAGEQLIPAIRSLSLHQPFLASRTAQLVFERYLQGGTPAEPIAPGGLTPREQQTVKLLAEGQSNKEVAATLAISVKTVETHRAAIMRKLGFGSFSELVRFAIRQRIVEA